MKKISTIILLALFSISVFTGCQKNATTTGYSMSADIGGSATIFDNSLINVEINSVTGRNTYIIEGLNNASNYPYVYIYVPAITDTTTYSIGVYTAGSLYNPAYAILGVDTLTIKNSASGSVYIKTVSPYVTGTYSFTCTDGTTVSAGAFIAKPLPSL